MLEVGQKTSFGSKITGAGGGGCIFALQMNQIWNNLSMNSRIRIMIVFR